MADIYAALAAVMADVDHVAKRDRNEHQRFLFRGIDAVVNAVGPVLRKHGVVVVPNVEHVSYDVVQTSTGKPATACRVLVTYSFYAGDGSSIDARVAAEAWDAGDKAAPKAMSVAFRTALLQALALPTDEPDPDSQVYERDHQRHQQTPTDPPPSWGDAPPDPTPMDPKSKRHMFALFAKKGPHDKDQQLAGIQKITGASYTSRGDLTEQHCQQVIAALRQRPDVPEAPAEGDPS